MAHSKTNHDTGRSRRAPRAANAAICAAICAVAFAAAAEPSVSTICIEAQSGLVIAEANADIRRAPASMVKMMQMLLVAEGLRDARWTPATPVTVTAHAQAMGGTQLFLEKGETYALGQLMKAVAVASANDAAMAVAEGLWGSEDAYKLAMNQRAAALGMANSVFHSVHGLPPDAGEEPDRTTARDMACLAQACVLEPRILQWTNCKEFTFKPGQAVNHNTNKLLWKMDDCDGLKTGFIRSAGFCVTATAARDNMRLIAVVMGGQSSGTRFDTARKLLDDGFAQVCRTRVLAQGEPVGESVPVANCQEARAQLTAAEDLWVVVKQDDADRLGVTAEHPPLLRAPIRAGDPLGRAHAGLPGKPLGAVALTVASDLAEAGWRWKLQRSLAPHHTASSGEALRSE